MQPIAFLVLCSALASCAVGPQYVRPADPAVVAFTAFDASTYNTDAPAEAFWQTLDDPTLTDLIETALHANPDLRAAVARLDRVTALARLSKWDLIPSGTATASYTQSRESVTAAPALARADRDADLYQGSVLASWELDLFGRVRRNIQATRADRDAAAADLAALQVSLAAEVARTYFELRGLQEVLAVAEHNAGNQRETLRVTELRLAAGRGTEFDTARARAQLESTLARIPTLQESIANTLHRLAVLDARIPSDFNDRLGSPAPLPDLPLSVAIGKPADLLRRRPDIAAAERRLAAATARIGVTAADLFPRLTLRGFYGTVGTTVGDLGTRNAESYGYGPLIDWSFLDIGRVRARIAAARADAAADLASYEGVVLRAYEETENALIGYSHARTTLEHLDAAAAASQSAAQLARLRFEGGATDFLQVLDAERSLLATEDARAQAHLRAATSLVAVYRTLGGNGF